MLEIGPLVRLPIFVAGLWTLPNDLSNGRLGN